MLILNHRNAGRIHPGVLLLLMTIAVIGAASSVLYLNTRRAGPLGSELHVYCAAGIKPPFEAAVARYREEFDVAIASDYKGSGDLLVGIQASQRGDIFIAAGSKYIEDARKLGLVDEAIPVARIRPVIAVPKGNPKKISTIDDLLKSDVDFALANSGAAIGQVTKAVLEKDGRWRAVEAAAKVSTGTVTEIAIAISLGTVDAGVIWDATAAQYPEIQIVRHHLFEAAEPQYVTVGILKTCKDPAGALRLARYLAAPGKGQVEFESLNYEPVNGDEWVERPKIKLYSGGVNRLAIQETVEEFEKREGVDIEMSFNGCGILVVQMKAGMIPDAYFACDASFVTEVAENFHESLTISETRMVILVQKGNPKGINSLADLARPDLRVGLADPKFSALGALTERLLVRKGLLAGVDKNRAYRSNTASDLVTQVLAGPNTLDAVIVYEANTIESRDKLTVVAIKDDQAYAVQPFVVSKKSRFPALVARLRAALLTATSRARFEKTGFHWRVEEEVTPK
jgi:molybdate transport system substrate-binding protein